MTSLSSDTFEDDLSFSATEFVSEDNSSVNHQFVNDSEVYSNFLSQVYAEVNFALALSFLRTPRLSVNGEDVIIKAGKWKYLYDREHDIQSDDVKELIGENYNLEDHIINRLKFSYKQKVGNKGKSKFM